MIKLIFEKGGLLMYPLMLFSIIAIAVIAEKIADLYKIIIRNNIFNAIINFVKEKNIEGIILFLNKEITKNKNSKNSLELIKKAVGQGASFKKECDIEISLMTAKISERIHLLDLIGKISPMTGLAGTVIGLAKTFQIVSISGKTGNAALLAGGIWEAMITTITGLLIAIPSIIAAHLLRNILRKHIERLRFCCNVVLFPDDIGKNINQVF